MFNLAPKLLEEQGGETIRARGRIVFISLTACSSSSIEKGLTRASLSASETLKASPRSRRPDVLWPSGSLPNKPLVVISYMPFQLVCFRDHSVSLLQALDCAFPLRDPMKIASIRIRL
jgi:hypothetical protein